MSSQPQPKPHDVTLLAYLRSLTVEERIKLNDAALKLIGDLREGSRREPKQEHGS